MLTAFYVPTLSSAVAWWRIQSFVECSAREGIGRFNNSLWFSKSNESQEWQRRMPGSLEYDPVYTRAFVPMIHSGCQQADVIIWQYVQEEGALALFEASMSRFKDTPHLVEIDDNILSVPPFNNAYEFYSPRSDIRRRVIEQLKSADGVIVSTPYLAEVLSELNDRIYTIPNSIDFVSWDKLKRRSRPGIRIGWAGGSAHEGDFEEINPAIKSLAKKHKEVKFVLINGPTPKGLPEELKDVPRIKHKLVWKDIKDYPRMLVGEDFDILIAPLLDCAFNRAKSNIKWLEGAAMGIPTVASSVGHFKDSITHGVDGFLAETPEEFEKFLNILITDKKLRREMGRQARRTAEKNFSITSTTKKYLSVMEDAVNVKRGLKEALA